MQNAWDLLSEKFDVHKRALQIDPNTADNILIAWPVIIAAIQKHFGSRSGLSAFDYGCGTGGFTQKLASLGFISVGIDHSAGMIEKAREAAGETAQFIVGSAEKPLSLEPVDLVSAIMVFQFIDDIDPVFRNITNIIKPHGMLVFAVHNPDYVRRCLEEGVLFSNFDSQENPTHGMVNLGTVGIPIFIRTAKDYTEVLQRFNFHKVLEEYPPFTSEFLAQYSKGTPTDVPEYLIMGFTR